MADQMAFVSAPAATPTIGLNLNQPGLLKVKRDSFSLGAPQFEGDPQSGLGAYGERTVELTLQATGTYDEAATVFQDVSQQLVNGAPGMGGRNWLMFRWSAADPLMFLWTLPSSMSALNFQNAGAGVWELPLSIVCDADIVGVPVDVAVGTITNDPSSGTNRMMATLPSIQGDRETPLLLAQTSGPGISSTVGIAVCYLSSYAVTGGFTHSFLARSLTELSSGTDTGATVAGAGANYIEGNYKACTFTTKTLQNRLTGSFTTALTPVPGLYRLLMRLVAPSGNGSTATDYTFSLLVGGNASNNGGSYAVSVSVPFSNLADVPVLVDFGVVQFPPGAPTGRVGLSSPASTQPAPVFTLRASQDSGIGSLPLRFDEFFLLPAETNYGTARMAIVSPPVYVTTAPWNVIAYDGQNDEMRVLDDASGTAPFSGNPVMGTDMAFVGGLPVVRPGANNYLQFLYNAPTQPAVTGTTAFAGRYYPRYVHPRPAAT